MSRKCHFGILGIGTTSPLYKLDIRGGTIAIPRNQYLTAYDATNAVEVGMIRWDSATDILSMNIRSALQIGDAGRFNTGAGLLLGAGTLGFGTATTVVQDVFITRDGAANTLAQRNGTSAQAFRVYNTYTDASNYERLAIEAVGNVFQIESEAAGTGTVRNIALQPTGGNVGICIR